jgi:hypothetical protein
VRVSRLTLHRTLDQWGRRYCHEYDFYTHHSYCVDNVTIVGDFDPDDCGEWFRADIVCGRCGSWLEDISVQCERFCFLHDNDTDLIYWEAPCEYCPRSSSSSSQSSEHYTSEEVQEEDGEEEPEASREATPEVPDLSSLTISSPTGEGIPAVGDWIAVRNPDPRDPVVLGWWEYGTDICD